VIWLWRSFLTAKCPTPSVLQTVFLRSERSHDAPSHHAKSSHFFQLEFIFFFVGFHRSTHASIPLALLEEMRPAVRRYWDAFTPSRALSASAAGAFSKSSRIAIVGPRS
jgi:hypothetical protein